MTVRRMLAVAAVGFAAVGFGGACAAQDDSGAMSPNGYHGPYLSWSGKKAAAPASAPAAPPDDSADLTEARYAPAPNYAPGGYAPQAPRDAPALSEASESRAGPPASSQGDDAAAYASARAPQPAPEAQAAPDAAPAPAQPAPQPQAPPPAAGYAQPGAAPASAQAADATSGVRFYSLHRAYGMAPDPIPAPTEGHTVLIAAPDHDASAQDQAGDADQDGDGDKPAAHADAPGDGSGGGD